MESRKKGKKRQFKPFCIYLLKPPFFSIKQKARFLTAIRRGKIIYASTIRKDGKGQTLTLLPAKNRWAVVPANIADEMEDSGLGKIILTAWKNSHSSKSPKTRPKVIIWKNWFF